MTALSAAKTYLATLKDDGRTRYDGHPDVLLGELVEEIEAAGSEPDVALLASMACCLNHGFGLDNVTSQNRQLADMRKLWDEVMGRGYYSPDNRGRYITMLATTLPALDSGGAGEVSK